MRFGRAYVNVQAVLMATMCAAAFVAIIAVFSMGGRLPSAVCADGWRSLSYNASGTCSHHGGVHRWGG